MAEESKQEAAPEPGAPIPPDAVDPELIALRRGTGPISPVLSVAVLIFCTYMMITLRADLRFSREGEQPRAVDGVAALIDDDGLRDRFVNVRAVPDRSFTTQVSTGEALTGQRVTPVLGTGDRVWIYADGNPWTAAIAYNEEVQGRLRLVDDVPFADGLREFVRSQPPTPRVVAVRDVEAALNSGATALPDPSGSQLAVGPDTPVAIHEVLASEAELVARTTADRLDEEAWNLVLTNAGVLSPGERPYQGNERAFWYRVPAPEGLAALRAKLRAQNLFGVDVRPVVEVRDATWGQLAAVPGGLRIGDRTLPWSTVDRVSVALRHDIPADAVILLTGELPAAYWYLLPIYVVMGLFALLFAWALVRAVRRMIPADA